MNIGNQSKQQKGVVALVLLAFGFGMIAIAARYLSYHYALFQQIYLSLGAAFIFSLFLFPRSLTLKKIKEIPVRDWGIMFFRVMVGYLLAASLYRQSLTMTKISNVTFVQSIPFAGLFGWLLFKEKFTLQKMLLLLSAYAGVLFIAVKGDAFIFSFGKGELFSLISSALFSLSYVSRKWQTNFLDDKEITQILLFLGVTGFLAASFIGGEGLPSFKFQVPLLLSIFAAGFFNAINIYLIQVSFSRP